MGMRVKEILAYDYVSFSGLFESCERDHAADTMERLQIDLAVAAAGAGGEDAFDILEDRMAMYRHLLGFKPPEERNDGMEMLARDFGRGL